MHEEDTDKVDLIKFSVVSLSINGGRNPHQFQMLENQFRDGTWETSSTFLQSSY